MERSTGTPPCASPSLQPDHVVHTPVRIEQSGERSSSPEDISASVGDGQPPRLHQMTTRLQHGIRKPNPRYALLTRTDIPAIPKTTSAALKHPGWTNSMQEEMDAQHLNGTMSLVPRTPEMYVLGCRWIHTVKLNADGTPYKLKSRLVARGYEQEECVDFIETYSPVVRTSTIRVVLNVAVAKDWKVRQFDVKNAFLHGELQEEVFIEQPPGFEDKLHP